MRNDYSVLKYLMRALMLPILFFGLFCSSLVALATPASPFNQNSFSELAAQFELSQQGPDLLLKVIPGRGHYLYQNKLNVVTIEENIVESVDLPPAKEHQFQDGSSEQVYDEPFSIVIKTKKIFTQEQKLSIDYQACRTDGLCLPPANMVIGLGSFENSQTVDESKTHFDGVGEDSKHASVLEKGSFYALITFFLLGLGLSFTPCVLPMLPILASIIAGDGIESSSRRGTLLAATYVLAMATAYALVGALVAYAGHNLQAVMQTRPVIITFSLVFFLLALSMFGVFELELPYRVRQKLSSWQQSFTGGRFIEAFMMGILASLVVSPCITPPLAGSLLYISGTGDIWLGAAALFVLGLGMGVPLVVIGAFEGALLPKAGRWMHWVKEAFGFALIFLAIWMLERVLPKPFILLLIGLTLMAVAYYLRELITALDAGDKALKALLSAVVLLLLVLGTIEVVGAAMGQNSIFYPLKEFRLERELDRTAAQHHPEPILSVEDLKDARASAVVSNKVIVLEFYADWCVNCKILEKKVFSDLEIQSRLQEVTWLKVDVTKMNAEKNNLMKMFAVFAPPVTIVILPDGEEARLVGLFDKKDLLSLMPQQ